MPISGQGWELHIVRDKEQRRGNRARTVGHYQIYHNGVPRDNLYGTSVETKGPGDNDVQGNGRCIEEGSYGLETHVGPHYCTIGYHFSNDPDETPKPCLGLTGTGNRTAILVHPGHGFLASVGCINLTSFLPDGQTDIPFSDSRDRVIAAVDDLKQYLGGSFPHYNGQGIKKAFVVID